MSSLVEAKRAFYRDGRVAEAYDRQRFGGASGAYVNDRELALTAALLPPHVSAMADVGAGTGRLLPILTGRASRVIALDTSLAMLHQAQAKLARAAVDSAAGSARAAAAASRRPDGASGELDSNARFVQADGFALPLRDGALEAATCMRVLFHFQEPRPLLRELRRVTALGGTLVCDTTTWSPRGLVPLGRRFWGERVASRGSAEFRRLAQQTGWRVVEERACFLISPYMYRRLPLALARRLERLERHLPRQLLCRRFWKLAAAG